MFNKINVEIIYKDSLCCSCGFCIGICPHNSISYEIDKHGFLKPVINYNTCTNCGLCFNLCPGKKDLKNKELKRESFCYGYSNNEETRKSASSGGIITELLCYIIDKNIVDYVTVISNRKKQKNPLPILTNDKSIIRECKTSKYCPVPIGEIIKQIKEVDGTVAVLGLPCQINALKEFTKKNTRLNQKIKYYFSLLCNHTPSYEATNFLAQNIGIKDWSSIKYRGNGWPGKMELSSEKQNIKKLVPYRKTWATGFGIYFKNRRCFICNDPFARNADIVFGDAYFMEKETKGMTFCIVRDDSLRQILDTMKKGNSIEMREGPDSSVVNKYFKVLYDREKQYLKKIQMMEKWHLSIPECDKKDVPNNDINYTIKELIHFRSDIFKIELGKYHILWNYLFNKNNGKKLTIETYENTTNNGKNSL